MISYKKENTIRNPSDGAAQTLQIGYPNLFPGKVFIKETMAWQKQNSRSTSSIVNGAKGAASVSNSAQSMCLNWTAKIKWWLPALLTASAACCVSTGVRISP